MNKEDDFMSDYDNAIFRLATAQETEPEDYIGEDGLLYCGKCRQPKKPTSRRARRFSDVTGTHGRVTARGKSLTNSKPPRIYADILTRLNG